MAWLDAAAALDGGDLESALVGALQIQEIGHRFTSPTLVCLGLVDIKASSHVHENLDLPGATFLYTTSTLHCMTVSLALGGTGLGTAWGEQLAVAMLGDAGFAQGDPKSIDTDPFNTYYVATKG